MVAKYLPGKGDVKILAWALLLSTVYRVSGAESMVAGFIAPLFGQSNTTPQRGS